MKHIILCITMILMFACMLPIVTANAATESEFVIEDGVLKEYKGEGGEIVIPEGVVIIAENAFAHNQKVTGVTMPNTVKRIEDHAFYGCYYLRYVGMEGSVESIGENAFEECYRLKNVRLSAALKELPYRAWSHTGLRNFTIPKNILYMDVACLEFCNKLEKVSIDPDCANKQAYQLASVLWGAKEYGGVTVYSRLGEMDESTKEVLLKQVRLEELALQTESLWLNPGEVYALAMNSDAKCDSWKSDNQSVAKVNRYGKITAKKPGKAVITATLYGREYQCTVRVADLSELREETPASKFEYEIRKGKVCIIGLKDKMLTQVWIPKQIEGCPVESIGEGAFAFDENLMRVVIPDSIKEIGDRAFHGCSSLMEINLPEGIDEIGLGVFWNCESLSNVRIPESVSMIDLNAFCGCIGLTEIELPENIKVINPGAFWGCENLKRIRIPERVSFIGKAAFEYCRELEEVELPDNVDRIGRDAFSNTAWLAQKEVEKGWIASGDTLYWVARSSEGVFRIPEGITKIWEYAFYECKDLTGVEIPASVREIREHAFADCSSLTEVKIAGDGLEYIADEAFSGCSSLVHPESMGGIGYKAFSGCSSLTEVEIPGELNQITGMAFFQCDSLTEVRVLEGVCYINDKVFAECSSLMQVELPASVTYISKNAFEGCNSALEFVVPEGSYAEEYVKKYHAESSIKIKKNSNGNY